MTQLAFQRIGVVGSGAMGTGIAQLFAAAGASIVLHDTRSEALEAAGASIRSYFAKQADKGKITAAQAGAAAARVQTTAALAGLAGCDLIIEAIVERLDAKRELFTSLEAIVRPDTVLASNTSSLSVTAIAATLKRPAQVAGYHFFNPVPAMKIVEVVRTVRTDPSVVARLESLGRQAGHAVVVTEDTPGFVVNHAGRGYGTEALRVLSEGVAGVETIDALMREQVVFDGRGFRLGPFELLDLTGLDVSHPVMESIYRQFYEEPRFRPSVITAQRLAAGLLGRKSGQGFYPYASSRGADTTIMPGPITVAWGDEAPPAAAAPMPSVWVAPGPRQPLLRALVAALGGTIDGGAQPGAASLILLAPLGLDATTATAELNLLKQADRVVAIDTVFPFGQRACKRRALMTTPACSEATRTAALALFGNDGALPVLLRDSPGFVAQRVVAMVVSIATEIAQMRIASPSDIDTAVRIGLGYPLGPLSMGDKLGAATVLTILENMHRVTGDPRYRPGLWLQRRARLGLSLLHED